METVNEKIRNKLSSITNVIALIERYENTINEEEKRIIIEHILKSKIVLKYSVKELIKIK